MAKVIDVAKLLCERLGQIDAYKLQKLTYYCQAWNLVFNNKVLFSERIEAWAAGPVCPALYGKHRGQYLVDISSFGAGNSEDLTKEEKDTIDFVIRSYGKHDGLRLSYLSHTESPWQDARKRAGVEDGAACSEEITTDDMLKFYLQFASSN